MSDNNARAMVELPKNVVQAFGDGKPTNSVRPAGAAIAPDLPLFRFGLRQLFFFVAAVSTLLAGLVSLDGIPALATLLAALVVAFHVFGTALGSRLRQYANRTCDIGLDEQNASHPQASVASDQRVGLPFPSPWYGRSDASFAWLPRLVATAAFLGGCLGAVYLVTTTGHRTSLAGLVVGAISSAALSGWFAFLGGSFVGIVRRGLSEAVAEQDSNPGRQPVPR